MAVTITKQIKLFLHRLAIGDHAMQALVVEFRLSGGLTVDEAAAVLGISPKAVKRDWAVARAWLFGDLDRKSCA